MDHQALDIGHICQQREDLQGINELPGFFLTALNLEGEDRTSTIGEVLLIKLMVVMTLKGWMVYLGHLGMVGEEIDDLAQALDKI